MSKRDSSQHKGRTKNTIHVFSKTYIYCNGDTEKNYFEGFRIAKKLPKDVVVCLSSEYNRDTLVDKAKKERGSFKKNPLDKMFIVFDADIMPKGKNPPNPSTIKHNVDKALQKCVAYNYTAILSNESFELWILLHFEDVCRKLHRDKLIDEVKKHIPNYEKADTHLYEKTCSNYKSAKLRSEKLVEDIERKNISPSEANPYTNVFEVIDYIEKNYIKK